MKPSYRWSLYAFASLLTAGAMAWVDRPASDLMPAVAARPAAAHVAAAATPGPRWTLPQRDLPAMPADDPFDPVDRAEPAAPVPMREPVQQRPQPEIASAPPLPFVYLGQWVEKGVTTAFLSTPQGINVAATVGATLEGSYRVERIDEQAMTLRYLPLNTAQTLSFTEARAGSPNAVANASAPAPADSGTEETN